MQRISVDFNSETMVGDGRVLIETVDHPHDPDLLTQLQVGDEVTVWEEGLEYHAKVEYDAGTKTWLGRLIDGTRQDLPIDH